MGLYDDIDLAELDNMSTDSEDSDEEADKPGALGSFMKTEKKKRAQLSDFEGFDDGDDNTIVRKMKGILALRESLGMDDDKSFMAEQERKAAERKKLANMTVEERMRYEEEQAGDVMSKIRARHVEKLKEAEVKPPAPKPQAPPMPGLKPLQHAHPMPGLKPAMPGLKPLQSEAERRAMKKKLKESEEAFDKKRSVRRSKSDDGLASASTKPRRGRRASIAGSAVTKSEAPVVDEEKQRKRMARRGSTGGRPTSMDEMQKLKEKSERKLKSSSKDPSSRKLSSSSKQPSSRRMSASASSSSKLSSKEPSTRKLKKEKSTTKLEKYKGDDREKTLRKKAVAAL